MIIIEVTYNTVYPSIEVTYDTTSVDVISTLSSSPVTIELDYSAVTIADLNLRVPYTGATGDVNLGEHGLTTGQVAFDLTPTGAAGVGVMKWNDAAGTVDLGLKGGNVTMQVGEDMVIRVVNKTGTNLLKSQYKVVRISSAQGQRLAVNFAQANNDNNSADTLGLVAENIDNNQEGFIQVMGQVGSLDTTGSIQGETWNDGDVLYLSPTVAGSITNVKPVAPQHIVVIGYIEYAHQNNGKIYVKVMNGWELGELHDVDTTGAVNGQVLKYNGTIWTPATDAGGISSITAASPLTGGTITTSGTIGINKATAIVDGYLSATDFSTFNSKQNTITLTTTGSSGAATLIGDTLNVPQYADQYVGTVTSVAALTLGTTGTDLSSSVANGTTTPVITLNVPTASATNRGALSSADWTTFNNKVGGTGASGQVAYWSGTGTQTGSNNLFWDNANNRLGIGTSSPVAKLDVISDFVSFKNSVGALGSGYGIEFGTNVLTPRIDFVVNGAYVGNFSASTTDVTFTNNLNNTGTISFRTVNSSTAAVKMRVFNNGNLLLQNGGTFTDGGQRLQVQGTTLLNGSLSVTSSTITQSNTTGSATLNVQASSGNASTIYINSGVNNNTATSAYVGISLTQRSNRNFSLGLNSANNLVFTNDVNGAGTLYLTVGGTYSLDISGTARSTGNTFLSTSGDTAIGTTTLGTATLLTISGSKTASSAIARGTLINTTLTAAANNDVLVGLDVNPTFTNGAFTGVSNIGLRIQNAWALRTNSTGTTAIMQSLLTSADFYGKSDNTGGFAFYGGGSFNTGAGIIVNGASNANPNQILFTRGAFVESARFTANSRFLLGTSIESTFLLDVNGTARVQGALTVSSTAINLSGSNPSGASVRLSVTNTSNTGASDFFFFNSDGRFFGGQMYGSSATGSFANISNNNLAKFVTDVSNFVIGTSAIGQIVFAIGATATTGEVARITTDSLTLANAKNIVVGTTTGTKIGTATSQKIGFWNAAPIVQPTTAVAEAAFVENLGGSIVNVDSTFDGYTMQQVVKALRDMGALA